MAFEDWMKQKAATEKEALQIQAFAPPSSAMTPTPVFRNMIPEAGGGDSLHAPTKPFMAHMDSLVNAPFVQDTLFPLIGGAPEITSAGGFTTPQNQLLDWAKRFGIPNGEMGGVMGEFMQNPERVQVNEVSHHDGDTENTLIHEAGHAMDFRHAKIDLDPLSSIHAWISNQWGTGAHAQDVAMTRLRKDLMDDLRTMRQKGIQHYAATNPREHFAETFTAALQALRLPDAALASQQLELSNDAVPGTKRMAEFLLSLPLFESHPLNQSEWSELAGGGGMSQAHAISAALGQASNRTDLQPPQVMAADATAVAPGAINPAIANPSALQQAGQNIAGGHGVLGSLLHNASQNLASQASAAAAAEASAPANSMPTARAVGRLQEAVSGSTLGGRVNSVVDALGFSDPISMLEGPGQAVSPVQVLSVLRGGRVAPTNFMHGNGRIALEEAIKKATPEELAEFSVAAGESMRKNERISIGDNAAVWIKARTNREMWERAGRGDEEAIRFLHTEEGLENLPDEELQSFAQGQIAAARTFEEEWMSRTLSSQLYGGLEEFGIVGVKEGLEEGRLIAEDLLRGRPHIVFRQRLADADTKQLAALEDVLAEKLRDSFNEGFEEADLLETVVRASSTDFDQMDVPELASRWAQTKIQEVLAQRAMAGDKRAAQALVPFNVDINPEHFQGYLDGTVLHLAAITDRLRTLGVDLP